LLTFARDKYRRGTGLQGAQGEGSYPQPAGRVLRL